MHVESKFYEQLHTKHPEYGLSHYDVNRLVRHAAFRRWLRRMDKTKLHVLDIGCGKGQFLLDLTETLRNSSQVSFSRIAAVDLVKAEGSVLESISPRPDFSQQSVDGQRLPFPDRCFDLVTCNHVLEHLFQTEHLLCEIRRVLQPEGLAVISVPNTAAWMNRIAFLFGGQPLGSELGTKSVTYGFWPGFLKHRLKRFNPSGHIRDFTPRSLREMSTECGFEFAGWWAQNGGLFATMMRNLGILLEPQRNQTVTAGSATQT